MAKSTENKLLDEVIANTNDFVAAVPKSEHYRVGGHAFEVSAEEKYLRLMDNYQPFSDAHPDTAAFSLGITPGSPPAFEEALRQSDGEQTIIFGTSSDGRHVFSFQWGGVMAGWLICSVDYRVGQLIPSGRYTKLAIDNALMIMYALATAGEGTLLFHAAVVRHRGKGYMFLGPSGTGKSTHARLWLQNIEGAELVNDDNPVVRVGEDGMAMVYGSPWSGKTPCYRNVACPLGGIVLLSQAPVNSIRPLRGIRAYAALVSAVSGTRWNRKIADGLHETESRLVASVPIWHMECLPDREAAAMCRSTISSD